ncbi:MAG: hypothetical protein Q7T10_16135 [Rhodoferax sp.]|uniref:hypothetical protein n=1 Tax=Rhodoferax sp. TaxID=50421 RepID=UPI00271B3B39|nr:hypothetical protein [Rhodoferax sp.]MDO8450328.1 hypothetical protein [Rhodoferax sp.]
MTFENKFEGSVWQSEPVSETPVVVLVGWHVFEVKLPGRAERTRHFSGTKAHDGHGKASTPIVQFDPVARRGVTESGRVYLLENPPGLEINAVCAWDAFVRVNRAHDVVDVSTEIQNMMERRA